MPSAPCVTASSAATFVTMLKTTSARLGHVARRVLEVEPELDERRAFSRERL